MLNEIQPIILIVEDDIQIRNFIRFALENEKYKVLTSENAAQAMNEIVSEPMDLILLDLGLPDADGMEVIKKVREFSDIPIIVVSARDQDKEKVKALDYGADDYLVKPFGMMEMVSRIKAVLRRCMPKKENKTVYVNGIIEMNVEEHTVSVSGESICLTYKEYEILKIFLMHPGMAYTRNRLLSEVWGIDSYGETRTVDMHIKTLRQKLGDGGRYIVTVRNVGYKMEVHND